MAEIDYSLYYRKWHSCTPQHADATAAYYRAVAGPHLPARRDAAVFDLGCGMGFTLLAYRGLGYQDCSGIDISREQVEAARAQGLRVEHAADSAAYLAARPAAYDFISAFDVLEHVPREHLLPLLRAVHASLKPGGVFVCVAPNANSGVAMRWRYNDWTHHTSFTEHSLDFVLRNGGFAAPRIDEVNFFQRRPPHPYLPRKAVARWLLASFFRAWRRMQFAAEFGFAPSRAIPLSLNIMAVARRADAQAALAAVGA
jgi:SAM-dependent methyltransferase